MNKSLEERTGIILDRLAEKYGSPECALKFSNTFELLVSVILSAQCTDKRVNITTEHLFKLANTPAKMLQLGEERLKEIIYPCGFYNNKAKNIISASKDIIYRFDGNVPSTIEKLMSLAGVGKKTANVVYAVGFGGQAIAVDTHVGRLANRLGLTKSKNPLIVERDLVRVVPKDAQTLFHHLLITHGRQVCSSLKPKCGECTLLDICDKAANEHVLS